MNSSAKIAALAPVSVAVVGLTQLHWMVAHLASIAELTAAVTVGTAMWLRMGRKDGNEPPRGSEPQQHVYQQALPPARTVSYDVISDRVAELRRN